MGEFSIATHSHNIAVRFIQSPHVGIVSFLEGPDMKHGAQIKCELCGTVVMVDANVDQFLTIQSSHRLFFHTERGGALRGHRIGNNNPPIGAEYPKPPLPLYYHIS